MIYNYELKNSIKKLNLKLFIHEVGKYRFNWHEKIEIILVLKGKVQVFSDGQIYNLLENDIILINPNSPHSTLAWGKGNIVLTLQFDPSYCKEFLANFDMLKIQCICFQNSTSNQIYNSLRNLLAKMTLAFWSKKKGYLFEIESHLNGIIAFILEECDYVHWDTKELQQEQKDLYKIKNIVDYIDENYSKAITLEAVAQKEYLNKYYLSHYFKKHMGINFSDYIAKVRFKNAIYELNATQKSISDIALDNGFPNVKSFNVYFKNNFKKTPSEYRRLFKDNLENLRIKDNIYVSTSNGIISKKLEEYAKLDMFHNDQQNYPHYIIDIHTSKVEHTFKKVWKSTFTLSNPRLLLNKSFYNYLPNIKEDLGLDYIKFSLDESFYDVDDYFIPLSQIISTLLKIGICPFLQISYNNASIIKLIDWCINKYGKNQLSQWRLSLHVDNLDNINNFNNLLEKVKYAGIQYGFSFSNNLNKIISHCLENDFKPDFFIFNTFEYIPYNHGLKVYQELKTLSCKISSDCKIILDTKYLSSTNNKPDSITSLYKTVEFLSSNLLSYDEILTFDLLDNSPEFPSDLTTTWFKNMPGLMTYNYIKKPIYYLFSFMNKLGSNLLSQNKNSIITSNNKNIQILLYNFYLDESTGMEDNIYFDISLKDIWGKYKIIFYALNRSNGAILRKFSDIGSPNYLTTEELDYIHHTCRPALTTNLLDINGLYNHSLKIYPWEIILICLDYISPLDR